MPNHAGKPIESVVYCLSISKPVLGGHPVLSAHYRIPRGSPLNTGFTVFMFFFGRWALRSILFDNRNCAQTEFETSMSGARFSPKTK